MATYTEPMRPYEFVLCDHGGISYENITLNSGSGTLVAGSVIGRITKRQCAAPIPAVSGSSPGNGVMTLLTFGPDVKVGTYTVACTAAVAEGGVFSVTDPDGMALPAFSMGTTTGASARYTSSHLSFTLTDGSSDFTTAARFLVVVAAAGTPVTAGGNGNAAMSAITLGKRAQLGTYKVWCATTGTHTATYIVFAPDGTIVPNTVDNALGYSSDGGADTFVSDHVNFTITDGSTDNVVGSYLNIIVAGYTSPAGMLWDPTAVDGTQEAYGIITHGALASGTVNVLTRLAEVKAAALTWKSTVTAAQKAEAYRQLALNNVIVRS